jgi:hypothetical protein
MTETELDELLVPSPIVESVEVVALAHSVAANGPKAAHRRKAAVTVGLVIAAVLAGGTAATAVPAVVSLLSEPQLATERTFVLEGESVDCSTTIEVMRDTQVSADDPVARDNLAAARVFLRDLDAASIEPDVSVLSPSQLAMTEGKPVAVRLIQSINEQVMIRFGQADLLRYGVSVEGYYGCDSEPLE